MKKSSSTLKPFIAIAAIAAVALVYFALQPGSESPPASEKSVKAAEVNAPEDTAPPEPVVKEVVKADPSDATASGNYLAGRHAEAVGEPHRALDFYQYASKDAQIATANLYSRMYVLSLTQGELDTALRSLDKAENLGGAGPLGKLARAVDFMKKEKFDAVITLFKKDDGGLSRVLTPAFVAWAELGKGNASAALKIIRETKNKGKKPPAQMLHTALVLDALGEIDQAAAAYKELQKLAQLPLRAIQLMGSNLERQGHGNQAIAFYQASASGAEAEILVRQAKARIKAGTRPLLDVNTPQKGIAEAVNDLATIMLTQGSWETALALANMAVYLRPDFPAAMMVIAASMERSQHIKKANLVYETIPNTSPLSWLARQHMAANYDRLDQTDKAIATLRTIADEHPTRARPLITLGDILSRHKRYEEAAVVYTEALSRVPELKAEHWGIFYARGISYEQSKQWKKAEPDLIKALALQPNHPMVLNYLGYSWIDQGLHLKKAVSMIRKAVDLRPRDGYIVDSLGWGLYRMGNFKAAVKSMERATMLRPADPLINDHLGDALWQVGRQREARFQWQRALDLDANSDIADTLREKLKNGLKAPTPQSPPLPQ
ncbi:MAG: tetratricopeptide repeat protein [Magnetovibrio sp.]|nr:tetratricopeptide repeat protein [Magnetovibrio sp.]